MTHPSFLESLKEKGRGAPRLLVRFPNWVGDAVMALPALEAIRRSMPVGRLAVLAKPWVAGIAEMSGAAGDVILLEDTGVNAGFRGKLRLAAILRRRRFDGTVLLPNSFGSALLAASSGIPLRGGYATDDRGLLLTHPVPAPPGRWPREHLVGYYLDLARSLGFDAEVEPIPRLSVHPAPLPHPTAVFAPGATYGSAKMWPAERFVELGRRLAARGLGVAILGSAAEIGVCGRIAAGIGPPAEDLSGKTTLHEAAGILAAAAVAVSNDSGLMHVAAAVGAPLAAVFGSTDPKATGPLSPRSRVVRGSAPCAPCFLKACPRRMECFENVSVDMVEAACLELMEEAEKGRGAQ